MPQLPARSVEQPSPTTLASLWSSFLRSKAASNSQCSSCLCHHMWRQQAQAPRLLTVPGLRFYMALSFQIIFFLFYVDHHFCLLVVLGALCLQRSEEGTGSPRTGAMEVVRHHVGAGNRTLCSLQGQMFLTSEPSFEINFYFYISDFY